MSHIRKQKQKDLIKKMNSLTNNSQLSLEDEIEIKLLQSQLDDIYTIKANGAYIPSRARCVKRVHHIFLDLKNKDRQRGK